MTTDAKKHNPATRRLLPTKFVYLLVLVAQAGYGATKTDMVDIQHNFLGGSLYRDILAWGRADRHEATAEDYMQAMHTIGYIQGIRDALQSAGVVCHNKEVEDMAGKEGVEKAVMAYIVGSMSQNQKMWNEPAYIVVKDAWTKILPCPSK